MKQEKFEMLCETYGLAPSRPLRDLVEAAVGTWQGLTDEEIALVCAECAASAHQHDDVSFARAIEVRLREKNRGLN